MKRVYGRRLRERRVPPKDGELMVIETKGRVRTVHKQVLLWRQRKARALAKLEKLKEELEELKTEPEARILKRKFFSE